MPKHKIARQGTLRKERAPRCFREEEVDLLVNIQLFLFLWE